MGKPSYRIGKAVGIGKSLLQRSKSKRGILYTMKNLTFTPNLACGALTVLLLVFSVHGIANAQGTLTISPVAITGHPGDEHLVTITLQDENGDPASGVDVRFWVSEPSGWFSPTADITNNDGIVESLLTLPIRSATVYVSATGYSTASMLVKVISIPHRLVIVSGNNQRGITGTRLRSPFVVRVDDINNYALPGKRVIFSVVSGGGQLSTAIARTDSRGEAQAFLTLGNMPGVNSVEVSVREVPAVRFHATGVGAAEKLVISSGADQRGFPNDRLAAPLTVRAIDSNGYGAQGVRVTFNVTKGSGRVSPSRTRTDADGFAPTNFTPSAPGTAIVEASADTLSPVTFTVQVGDSPDKVLPVSGRNQNGAPGSQLTEPFVVEVQNANAEPIVGIPVTFTVTAGGGHVSAATAATDANGQAQTYLTLGHKYGVNTVKASVFRVFRGATFKATSQAQVLITAATHPPLYWINTSANTLHRLVGAAVENLAPGVQGVTSLAVDTTNGLLYFGVKTGANRSEIRRSELTGENIQTLQSGLLSVPVSIALDSANGMLYWTGSDGKIKRTAAGGSTKVTSVLQGLDNLTSIAVSNGYLYWAESRGRIRRVNLAADQKVPMDIATDLGKPVSIAVTKGEIYWIEHSGGGRGRLKRTNLRGTNIEELRTFTRDVPFGIAVDDSDNKIYWTRSMGTIQRANLAGRFVTDVVTGLMRPGVIILGGTLPVDKPIVERTTRTAETTTKPHASYDVNEDGRVDNADAELVAYALGTDNLDYDVNSDGDVNFDDLLLVFDNRDNTAAGAPSVMAARRTVVQVDRIQVQIEMLRASGDTSLVAQQVLMYLQHLLASARPAETVLLANYPNPFNPETWIPYHLATSTDVKINIYNAQGTLVRALTLGHQSAGYYTSRSRAAYWEGRNTLGERVASGIYFYQLEADGISPLRKMVILK